MKIHGALMLNNLEKRYTKTVPYNYARFNALVSDCQKHLRSSGVCYCFTPEHIEAIKGEFPNLVYVENGAGFTCFSSKSAMDRKTRHKKYG